MFAWCSCKLLSSFDGEVIMTATTAEQQLNQTLAARQEAVQAELMPYQPDAGELFSNFGDRVLRESHNFKGTPQDVLLQIMKASAPDVINGDDKIDTLINLRNFYIHEADLKPDRAGEVRRVLRTVLYDANGKRYSFVSNGVALDLYRMVRVFGQLPFIPPIPVVATKIKTSSNYNIIRLVPAEGPR